MLAANQKRRKRLYILPIALIACGSPGGGGAQVSRASEASPQTAPAMSVVPLESGNYSSLAFDFRGVDDTGRRVIFGGDSGEPQSTYVLDLPVTKPRRIAILPPVSSTEERLTADGKRLYLEGGFALSSGGFGFGIGYIAVDDGRASELQAATTTGLYSVDRTGRWLAYQAPTSVGDGMSLQMFLRDEVANSAIQLTSDVGVVDDPAERNPCARGAGSAPLVNASGTHVVLVTRASLGVAPAGSGECRVFIYDIAMKRLQLATTLPEGVSVGWPALSADGRWYSFVNKRSVGDGVSLSTAALLDLESGQLSESLTEDKRYPSFDSIVSADGSAVVLSSQSDLDPRVGNADHNMELFVADIATGEFTQATDTIDGLEPDGGGVCPSLRPVIDATAGTMIVAFYQPEVELCPGIRRPQRHVGTGLFYRFGRVIRTRPGNHPPDWTPPSEARVAAGQTLRLDLSASDPDGDPLTFFAQEVDKSDVPRGSVIEDHYDGTATFRWPTRLEQAGEYTLRLAVFDQVGGERVHDVHITVGAADPVPCPGDCDGDAVVGVAELVAGVRIALQEGAAESCAAADGDGDGRVTVDELIRATGAALNGC